MTVLPSNEREVGYRQAAGKGWLPYVVHRNTLE